MKGFIVLALITVLSVVNVESLKGSFSANKGQFPEIALITRPEMEGRQIVIVIISPAVIVSDQFVVALASTIESIKPENYDQHVIKLGAIDYYGNTAEGKIAEVIQHPDYKPGCLKYNIALIRLKEKIVETD